MTDRGRYETRQAVSAGGVVYRLSNDDLHVLLLQTPKGIWGLPKGTPDDGETLLQTACREVREETGLLVDAEEKIGTIQYWFAHPDKRQRLHKFVHFWLMRPTGGSLDDHDDEHVSVRWFPVPDALHRVTHDNAAEIIEQAVGLVAKRDSAASQR
jgi:8-oxo-dGTP pyrophosphatase MutT (NUDIX family)